MEIGVSNYIKLFKLNWINIELPTSHNKKPEKNSVITMDASKCMIIDLKRAPNKDIFITKNVESIRKDEKGYWSVKFFSNYQIFSYNPARLLYLTHPIKIDVKIKGVYINNVRITGIAKLLRFTHYKQNFYHLIYTNGYAENYEGKDVYITRTPINECGTNMWDYLIKLADETGLCDEDGNNVLLKGYSLVDLKRDNVPLAQYLGNKDKLANYPMPRQVYYPFGCNASQKAAVESALTHQVSIIQGPPGTGKTQTILNIVANLILSNKSVLIVSNNNSAVANVAEKLQKENLGFIVAQLGNAENKEAFIKNQQPHCPVLDKWILTNISNQTKLLEKAFKALSQGFKDQTQLAQLKAEYHALVREKHYRDLLDTEFLPGSDWLNKKSSKKLIKLLTRCQFLEDKSKQPNSLFRLKWSLLLGPSAYSFLKNDTTPIIESLQKSYYQSRKKEIERLERKIKKRLSSTDLKQSVQTLTVCSLQLLKHKIARRYNGNPRFKFTHLDLKKRTKDFLTEYPVVLSSTYMSNSNISPNYVFDYVIMDEASQVDIKTGALALSCASNAVIVGDDKQLPNVVSKEEALALHAIQQYYSVPECYNTVTHSFLRSCTEVFKGAPTTLLREHYRCHPKIIEFCNQRFYDGELISMTKDSGEKDVLHVIKTAKGDHARRHFNQREIDVIQKEVLPYYKDKDSLGIITPYRDQAEAINKALGMDIASTVHKYQGRECDTIIMSMVDNTPTEFSDDANLMNVAISRAKSQLCIVTSGNEIPDNTNLAQLIDYIRYNNFAVTDSKLHSVFDLLYKQNTAERLAYQAAHPSVSKYLSENLVYTTLLQALQELRQKHLSVVCHYPLCELILDGSLLNDEEKAFSESKFAHVDLLIYNNITKKPVMAIEVDGWHYHKGNSVQQSRDKLKDSILNKYKLSLYRICTTDIVTVDTLKELLKKDKWMKSHR